MKKLLILNGSPKKRKSQSEKFAAEILKNLSGEEFEVDKVYLYELNYSAYLYEQIYSADMVVLATPLYIDCLPAKVIEMLEGLQDYPNVASGEKVPEVYLIMNCGFWEHTHNRLAISIVERFCSQNGFAYMQGISIGSGALITQENQFQQVERAVQKLSNTIKGKEVATKTIEIQAKMFRFRFIKKSDDMWLNAVKKKGWTAEKLKKRYYE